MNEDQFDKEFDFERYKKLKNIVAEMNNQDKDLLERLGSDYDEEGIPYWDIHNG